jgi:hypothetical protein
MVEVVETLEAKLKRHEDALVACIAEIQRLRAENASLRANNASAHQTLRAIYADSSQPATVRVRAAQAALNVETPSLKPEPAPLELNAEPVIPLADLVRRRRARVKALEGLPPGHPLYLEWVDRDGADFTDSAGNSSAVNGSDDDTAAS